MGENKYTFRAVDPRNDDDMHAYFSVAKNLSDFLKNNATFDEDQLRWARIRMGAVEYVDLEEAKGKPLIPIEQSAQEFAFVCECDGEIAGYVDICDYHVDGNQVIDDDTGAIHEIYVKPAYRKDHSIAFELFKMAIDKLLSLGKTKAVCNVQEDNPNRFLHFALADGKVLEESSCVRRDGSETTDYRLLIDFENLKGMTGWQLIKKASRLKKQYNDKKKENELNV